MTNKKQTFGVYDVNDQTTPKKLVSAKTEKKAKRKLPHSIKTIPIKAVIIAILLAAIILPSTFLPTASVNPWLPCVATIDSCNCVDDTTSENIETSAEKINEELDCSVRMYFICEDDWADYGSFDNFVTSYSGDNLPDANLTFVFSTNDNATDLNFAVKYSEYISEVVTEHELNKLNDDVEALVEKANGNIEIVVSGLSEVLDDFAKISRSCYKVLQCLSLLAVKIVNIVLIAVVVLSIVRTIMFKKKFPNGYILKPYSDETDDYKTVAVVENAASESNNAE